jgi:hypothetical protein
MINITNGMAIKYNEAKDVPTSISGGYRFGFQAAGISPAPDE